MVSARSSSQLSTLGSRLSRIESLLPAATQGNTPSTGPPADSDSTSGTARRFDTIERRISNIDTKLDSILSILSNLTRFGAHGHGTLKVPAREEHHHHQHYQNPHPAESEYGDNDESRNVRPAGEPLLTDSKGNVYYLGRSSNFSFTADAEILVKSRLRESSVISTGAANGPASRDISRRISPEGPGLNPVSEGKDDEGEEDARFLSGMVTQLGEMGGGGRESDLLLDAGGIPEGHVHNAGDEAGGHARTVPASCKFMTDDFYIPTSEELEQMTSRECPLSVYNHGVYYIQLLKKTLNRYIQKPSCWSSTILQPSPC